MDERTVDTMRRRISDYDEISELVFEKLEQMEAEFVVTEGAAYTPNIM